MIKLNEADGVLTEPRGSRYLARIIEADVWGSSGFYPREILERDGAKTWPAGTPVFIDHPGREETWDRPERSIRDLAGKIATTPEMREDGLYCEIVIYSHYRELVKELWESIGLSIRAEGLTENREVEGREGAVVVELSRGISVDLVTKPGAGGKLASLLESSRKTLEESTVKIEELQEANRELVSVVDDQKKMISELEEKLAQKEKEMQTALVETMIETHGKDLDRWAKTGLKAMCPLTENGGVDAEKFEAMIKEAVAERQPDGRPAELGAQTELSESDFLKKLGVKGA